MAADRFVGVRLEDRYEVLRPLARGGMGQVYVGFDQKLAVEVAVKFLVLRDGSAPGPELELRFEREAKILAKLRDPRILRPLTWGRTTDGVLFMITELLEGRPLDAVLRDEERIDEVRTVRVALDVCHALVDTHAAGVLHRDLKPANLFIQASRTGGESTMVLDFGIAKVSGDPAAAGPETTPGIVMGTVAYMSPEQARAKPAIPQSDLYALGVVMFECLSGATPFSGDYVNVMLAHVTEPPPTFAALGLRVDAEVEAVVRSLLEKDAGARPESAAKLIPRLERILARLAPAPKSSGAVASLASVPSALPLARPSSAEPSATASPPSAAWSLWLGVLAASVTAAWLGYDLLAGAAPTTAPAAVVAAADVPPPPAASASGDTVAGTPEVVAARPEPVPARPDAGRAAEASANTAPAASAATAPDAGPATAATSRPKPSASVQVELTSRVGVADTPGNTRSVESARRAVSSCASDAPFPFDVAFAILADGRARAKVSPSGGQPVTKLQACVDAAVAELRFEASGGMAVLKLRARGPQR